MVGDGEDAALTALLLARTEGIARLNYQVILIQGAKVPEDS